MRLGMSPNPSINKAAKLNTEYTEKIFTEGLKGHEDEESSLLVLDNILCCLFYLCGLCGLVMRIFLCELCVSLVKSFL